jgi:hypothetical protein
VTFRGWHRPIEAYAQAIEDAGLVIERIREPRVPESAVNPWPTDASWQRIPMFLHLRARKP